MNRDGSAIMSEPDRGANLDPALTTTGPFEEAHAMAEQDLSPLPFFSKRKHAIDKTGHRYGKLYVLGMSPKRSSDRKIPWLCRCDCGRVVTVSSERLKPGNADSCGCLGEERRLAACTKHGMYGTPEYHVWEKIIYRCGNSAHVHYKNYGGRGIKVCQRWRGEHGFENFYADMGPRPSLKHSIDRTDNDGNYEPDNCRWVTAKEQNRNRRNSKIIEAFGKGQSFVAWAEECGLPERLIRHRISDGWSSELAISTPRMTRGGRHVRPGAIWGLHGTVDTK
jgi:hypothetical protein